MKKFYRCRICGTEFCLKGRKYCEEGGSPVCGGQPPRAGQPIKNHLLTSMEYAGGTIEELRVLRRKHKDEI